MPFKPKNVDRPWIVKTDYNSMQGQGRKVVSRFYHLQVWKRFRKRFINGYSDHLGTIEPHPNRLCIDCAKRGVISKTHTVDHIKRINPVNAFDTEGGLWGEPLTWTNCQPLCESCHAKKSAKDKYQ